MILGFKQLLNGEPTLFKEKILLGIEKNIPAPIKPKVHTIREGYRWHTGMSIQMAYGVRTKHYDQFNIGIPELSICKSVQRIFMTYDGYGMPEITVGDKYLMHKEICALIENDGLALYQFLNWFFPSGKDEFSGQIIHWTDLKY